MGILLERGGKPGVDDAQAIRAVILGRSPYYWNTVDVRWSEFDTRASYFPLLRRHSCTISAKVVLLNLC